MDRRYEETHRTTARWSANEEILAGIGMGIVFFLILAVMHIA